jgi:hypothetical protein
MRNLYEDILARSPLNPTTGCWVWQGATRKRGYGEIKRTGKMYSTHRVVYETLHGPIPDGYMVCHKCDNPACNNPDHLFLGNAFLNMQDMAAKKRHPQHTSRATRGGFNGNAKLTEQQVLEIRAIPVGTPGVAKRFNVSPSTLSLIRKGQLWRHLGNP